ncbi:hypothetical protein KUL106_17590 [Alteromonas sp. KUL106]|nr:hypothetical protein KUL106_17590 [Alteromonas sp. KUL106]
MENRSIFHALVWVNGLDSYRFARGGDIVREGELACSCIDKCIVYFSLVRPNVLRGNDVFLTENKQAYMESKMWFKDAELDLETINFTPLIMEHADALVNAQTILNTSMC